MNIYSAIDEEQTEPKQPPQPRIEAAPPRRQKRWRRPQHRPLSKRWRRLWQSALLLCVVLSIYPLRRILTLYRADLSMQNVVLAPASPITSRDRVLILSPHLDDETLGAGGTLARAVGVGARVRVVFFTNGDGSGSTVLSESVRRRRRLSYLEIARLRQREAVAALRELGVSRADIIFLGYPDGGLQSMWEDHWHRTAFRSSTTGYDRSPYANSYSPKAPYRGAQVLRDVSRALNEFRPTLIFTTHPADTHPDHWAAYAYTRAALESLRGPTARSSTAPRWANRARIFGFLVHHGVWPVPHGYDPTARLSPPAAQQRQNTRWTDRNLSPDEQARKTRALERYVSQLVWTPLYLRAFLRRNEPFGALSEVKIGAQSTLIMRDEPNDNIRQTARPGTDLRAIRAISNRDAVTFVLQLGGAPSAAASYKLSLHSISNAAGAQNFVVSGASANDVQEDVQAARKSLEIRVPWKSLGTVRPSTVLVSVSIRAGNSVLDQSETAVLKLR